MLYFNARDLLHMTRDELVSYPQQLVTLTFDDGEVSVQGWRATVFSWYLWEFHRQYPDTPLLVKHHIGLKRFNKNTHVKTMNHCFWEVYDTYRGSVSPETLSVLAYDVTQTIFNDGHLIEEWLSTLTPEDFLDILDHPEVKEINENCQPNEIAISDAHRRIDKILRDEHQLRNNWLANDYKSDLVKSGQALQCVSMRGYLTDLDSHRFEYPVMQSYAEGIYTLYESVVESRSATKSLLFNKELIQETEYFNREMQLLTHVMSGLAMDDCGTKRTIPVRIRNKDDLRLFDGKYYVDQSGGLKVIRPISKELIGQKVSIRAVSQCQCGERGKVCKTCYGEMALSVPVGTNIGHIAATEICRIITQKVLSNKHLDQSSLVENIVLSTYDSQFLRVMRRQNELGLSESLYGLKTTITFTKEQAPYLVDIKILESVPEHSLSRYSQLDTVMFDIVRKDGTMLSAPVNVSVGSRLGYFTPKFLKHIKQKGWTVTSEGHYQVSLDGFSNTAPIFALPMKQMNMLDFAKEVEGLVKRTKRYPAGKASPNLADPEIMSAELMAMYDLINTRATANFVHIETLLQSTLIVSEDKKDFRIPVPGENVEFGRFTNIIRGRSLSTAMAHESQEEVLNSVASYLIEHRMAATYDECVVGYD